MFYMLLGGTSGRFGKILHTWFYKIMYFKKILIIGTPTCRSTCKNYRLYPLMKILFYKQHVNVCMCLHMQKNILSIFWRVASVYLTRATCSLCILKAWPYCLFLTGVVLSRESCCIWKNVSRWGPPIFHNMLTLHYLTFMSLSIVKFKTLCKDR